MRLNKKIFTLALVVLMLSAFSVAHAGFYELPDEVWSIQYDSTGALLGVQIGDDNYRPGKVNIGGNGWVPFNLEGDWSLGGGRWFKMNIPTYNASITFARLYNTGQDWFTVTHYNGVGYTHWGDNGMTADSLDFFFYIAGVTGL